MRMSREEHEALLNELLTPDLEQSRKSEILQSLRTHDATFTTEFEELTGQRDKLQKNHDDLVVSNSQLFRQLGTTVTPSLKEEVEQKEFSETITLEQLENRQ